MDITTTHLLVRLFIKPVARTGLLFRAPVGLAAEIEPLMYGIPFQRPYMTIGNEIQFHLDPQYHRFLNSIQNTPVRTWRQARASCLSLIARCHERGLLTVARPLDMNEFEWLCQSWFYCNKPVEPVARQIPVRLDYVEIS